MLPGDGNKFDSTNKTMNRFHLLPASLLAALLLSGAPMLAGTVTLDSCRNMAVRNNKAIKIAQENVRGAGYLNKAAKAAYLPGIDFTGGYMYNQHEISLLGEDAKLPTLSFDPASASFKPNILVGPNGKPVLNPKTGEMIPTQVAVIPKKAMQYDVHNVFAGVFTLTQPIYVGGTIRAMNQITKYAERFAQSMQNSAIQDVIFSVDEAYWQVVSLREKKKLAESFVSLVDSLRHNVTEMYKEGVATRSDELNVEVKYNEACIALTKVDNGLTLSRMNLARICGLPVDSDIDPEEDNVATSEGAVPDYSLAEAVASRPDLDAVRQSISVLESREKLSLGAMLPKIVAVGAWGFSNPNVIDGFEKRFGGGFSVGATLSVPLWHWGGNYNKLRAAKSNTAAQRLMLEDLEEKVDLQLSQAKFSMQEAYKTYEMTENNLSAAGQNLKNAEIGFSEGVMTADDVLKAQTAWLQAHSEYIDAQIGLRLCRTYLAKVAGKLL